MQNKDKQMGSMLLETDKQTLEDLGVFAKRDTPGIFDLYNHTHTRGGEELLRDMFRQPLSDAVMIRQRGEMLAHFADSGLEFPFDAALFDMAEKYIRNRSEDGSAAGQELGEKDIQNGVASIIRLLQELRAFTDMDAVRRAPNLGEIRTSLQGILADPVFGPVFGVPAGGKVAYAAYAAFDRLFRAKEYEKIEQMLTYIYQLDAYLSVARAASERGFVFPEVNEKGSQTLRVQDLYHPELKNPVANDITMVGATSLVFLTGANMAGKSTFLRSIGTAVYLAHMGFPVAASAMAFSVMDGLYTTINLPDNLGIGASHFYAEVLRVKKIATELSRGKTLFVIFDELFRGTNVKDAHEATVAITQAFAKRDTCRFIISSHIVEAAEELKAQSGTDFLFLPTQMNGHVPEYTYTLERGVTDDRHGMVIIRNEGILDILKNGRKRAVSEQATDA